MCQVRTLLDMGFPQESIETALALLLVAPCSVNATERGHAPGAVLMRGRELYTEKALVARATLRAGRTLVGPTLQDKVAERAERALDRLARRRPAAVGGRHMFCKALVRGGVNQAVVAVGDRFNKSPGHHGAARGEVCVSVVGCEGYMFVLGMVMCPNPMQPRP